MQVTLKKLDTSDALALQTVSYETYEATFGAYNPRELMDEYMDEAYKIEQLESELANPESYFYFLMVDNQVAGYLKLNVGKAQTEAMADEYLEVQRIYLRTKFQGQGLGGILIQKAEEIAQKLGKTKLWLGVWEHNYQAQKFYNKLGFKRFSQHHFMMGDDAQTDYMLEKNLQAG